MKKSVFRAELITACYYSDDPAVILNVIDGELFPAALYLIGNADACSSTQHLKSRFIPDACRNNESAAFCSAVIKIKRPYNSGCFYMASRYVPYVLCKIRCNS